MASDLQTRRELTEYAYGILTVDAIAVVIGGVASRHFGAEMWLVGAALGAYVGLCACIVILGDLTIQRVIDRWERHRTNR